MNLIFLFDFIKKFYGDKETTLVHSLHTSQFRSEQMSFFQYLVEKRLPIKITDLDTKEDFYCNHFTLIDYFTFINGKIIIYFK